LFLAEQGRFADAIEHYRAALRLQPGSARTHADLGNVLAAAGRADEAAAEYGEALHLAPDDAGVHNNLGNVLVMAGRVDDGLAHYVLLPIDCHVAIVDDDSPDGTGAVVRAFAERDPRVHLVNHRPRRGIGPAYKDGFRAALALAPEFVVQMDADFSHSPATLP